MLRPEPRPDPDSSSAMRTHGLQWRSTSRDATMPMTPGCHPSPASTSAGSWPCSRQRRLGREGDSHLGVLALAVQEVQLAGDLARARVILGEQQLERRVRPAHAACGVDPRPQPEAEPAGIERAGVA